jgi:hypothetical protein
VYDVPADKAAAVAALALERNAGLIHITDDIEPTPYDTVPNDAYMKQLMGAVTGGQLPNDGIFPRLGGPVSSPLGSFKIDSFDYSSATVSWTPSPNAIGYHIV